MESAIGGFLPAQSKPEQAFPIIGFGLSQQGWGGTGTAPEN